MTGADLREASVESLFESAGALLDGHFLLKSGRHAGRYLEKFLVLQHPRYGVELCRRFAEALRPYAPTLSRTETKRYETRPSRMAADFNSGAGRGSNWTGRAPKGRAADQAQRALDHQTLR